MPVDDETFESLLDQVRDLHRLADEATRERARFDAYVQARLRWDDRNDISLPTGQRDLADEAVEALSKPRLSSSQSRLLYRASSESQDADGQRYRGTQTGFRRSVLQGQRRKRSRSYVRLSESTPCAVVLELDDKDTRSNPR